MAERSLPPVVRWSVRLYGQLLRCYPAAFRRTDAAQVVQLFRDQCRASYAETGPLGVVRLWLPGIWDLLINGAAEHLAAIRRAFAPAQGGGPMSLFGMDLGPPDLRRAAVRQGAFCGLALSLLLALLIAIPSINETADEAEVGLGFLLMLLVSGVAGFRTAPRSAAPGAGVLAGGLTGLIAALAATGIYLAGDILFFDTLSRRPERLAHYAISGIQDLHVYLLAQTLLGGIFLALVAVGMGAILGAAGAMLGGQRSARS